ncbi:unnamed protein product [Brassicogethes aeneus]|uniref:RING-type E3 ubiquitin transferase n=1 Tax=Brassicogethes aeneus TaxID=1431903 RepID=A0A9P0AWL5_BRAAE|nr:unnamed protein product [Brassicogethes aeneus]
MANETMNQFTDELLKEKIFHCKICDELCLSDNFLVKGTGNVCAECFKEKCGEEMKSKAESNTGLIFILAKLMLPCKFQFKGCNKRVASKNYSKHICSCRCIIFGCDYKIKQCPMKNFEGCDWSGTNFEVSGHLLKTHEKQVIKSENNIFKVETVLSEPFNMKILSNDYQNCLLKTSVVDNKFYYALNPVEKSEENVEYSVVHRNIQKPKHSVIKTIGTLTKLNGIYNEQNLNENPNATVVDIDSLKNLADDNNMISNEFNLNPMGIDENMLKLLECPVCMSTMRPPIYQCNRGHSICIICHGEVNACPTCKGEWSNVRNFLVENLTANIKYTCKFKKLGCKEIAVEGEIKKHEETCLLNSNKSGSDKIAIKEETTKFMGEQFVKCKFDLHGCKEIGIKSEMIKHEELCGFCKYKCPLCPLFLQANVISKHVKDSHNGQILGNRFSYILNYSGIIKLKVFDSKLFRISNYFDDSYIYWVVELICSKEDPSLYTYEIFFSKNANETPLVFKSTCLKEQTNKQRLKFHGIAYCDYTHFKVSLKKAN